MRRATPSPRSCPTRPTSRAAAAATEPPHPTTVETCAAGGPSLSGPSSRPSSLVMMTAMRFRHRQQHGPDGTDDVAGDRHAAAAVHPDGPGGRFDEDVQKGIALVVAREKRPYGGVDQVAVCADRQPFGPTPGRGLLRLQHLEAIRR